MDRFRATHGNSRHCTPVISNDSDSLKSTPAFAFDVIYFFLWRDSFTVESVKNRINLCLQRRNLPLEKKCEIISSLLEIPKYLFDGCDESDVYTIGVLGYAVLRPIYLSLLKELRFESWDKEKWDYYYSFVITSLFFHGNFECSRVNFSDDDRKCFFYVSYMMSVCTHFISCM
mgnify:CR=1 FL=1